MRNRRYASSSDDPSGPKTTRPRSASRRSRSAAAPALKRFGRSLDALPDRIDIRDWFYQPSLAPLPDVVVNRDRVPLILDQGQEGACTGFALAAVINFHLQRRFQNDSVSPRMLYEMARRHDEWPGEGYDGSSARGAMKGWVRHGVCLRDTWPDALDGFDHLTPTVVEEAQRIPGGAYYRVMHRKIRDMHSAIAVSGILYATLMIHDGWFNLDSSAWHSYSYYESGSVRKIDLPIIERKERAVSGHAVALVGYTEDGFIVQNSWGEAWGNHGFALLPYEDYLLHATDVWVAQLGVPVKADLWEREKLADSTAGLHRAAPVIPLADIRPFVIDVGNNGELSSQGDYWTTEEDIRRLFLVTPTPADEPRHQPSSERPYSIPDRTKNWAKRRVLLFFHSGLNDERAVARRIVAYRDIMLRNEIYPLHIMWETGVMESIGHMIDDLFIDADERTGGPIADWLRKTREGLFEAKDWSFELTAAAPAGALWREMKDNARYSSEHPKRRGAMQVLSARVAAAISGLADAALADWELHVVAHSAGSIYCAYAMRHLIRCGIRLKTIQFLAPAITLELFKERMRPLIAQGKCPKPDLYILSDTGERDDDVGPYGKSLLYLISNAFEGRRGVPLLGMEKFIRKPPGGEDSTAPAPDPEIERNDLRAVVVAGAPPTPEGLGSESESHAGFDNDLKTMNSVLTRILDGPPPHPFDLRDLQF